MPQKPEAEGSGIQQGGVHPRVSLDFISCDLSDDWARLSKWSWLWDPVLWGERGLNSELLDLDWNLSDPT